ncbi:exosome complex exonuclease RRP46, partial [Tanacetum coccineum]
VVNDDGALLPCAINAACAALVDAGIPLKHLAVAICCCVAESGHILLDPSKIEEQKVKAFIYLVFPNSIVSVLPQDVKEHGIITSVTHGAMAVDDYFRCLKLGRAAAAEMSDFLRNSIKLKAGNDPSRAG